MNLLCVVVCAEILCGSWNLKWFPSGRAEHRASARVEKANRLDAAEVIRGGLAKKGNILFLQELRDEAACRELVAEIGHPGLSNVCVSAFRDFDNRLMWQQVAIVTDLPVVESGWSYWKRSKKVFPPRGYAYALLDAGDCRVACYCVHLKSNYGARTEEAKESNRRKRATCTEQLVKLLPPGKALIAGDFNTDPYTFPPEATLPTLYAHGFTNVFVRAVDRITHPGTRPATFDFILPRGFDFEPPTLAPLVPLSDHRMVFLRVR